MKKSSITGKERRRRKGEEEVKGKEKKGSKEEGREGKREGEREGRRGDKGREREREGEEKIMNIGITSLFHELNEF